MNFTCFFLLFKNVASRKSEVMVVARTCGLCHVLLQRHQREDPTSQRAPGSAGPPARKPRCLCHPPGDERDPFSCQRGQASEREGLQASRGGGGRSLEAAPGAGGQASSCLVSGQVHNPRVYTLESPGAGGATPGDPGPPVRLPLSQALTAREPRAVPGTSSRLSFSLFPPSP